MTWYGPPAMAARGFPQLSAPSHPQRSWLTGRCVQIIRGTDPSTLQLRPSDDEAPSHRLKRVLDDLQVHMAGLEVPETLARKRDSPAGSWSDNEVVAFPAPCF